jgi:uncharacterized SAM-binding protein YcdF (DUF218 family)
LESLMQPLALVFVGLAAATVRAAWLRQRRWVGFGLGLLLVLWVPGSTPLTAWLLYRLERPFLTGAETVSEADAVVMLGGTHFRSLGTVMPFDLGDAGDRPVAAMDLFLSGRAGTLVMGGSHYEVDGVRRPDAELLWGWMARWRLPTNGVVVLKPSRDTRDEVQQVAELARERGWRRVIVVSSGFHLRRGVAAMRHAGLEEVHGVSAENTGRAYVDASDRWRMLPDAYRLILFRTWLHEELGWWYYRWNGWI